MKRKTRSAVWAISQLVVATIVTFTVVIVAGCSNKRSGETTLHVLETNDVHGAWFDSTYVGGNTKPSLLAVNYYIDSIRNAVGEKNVLLIDAGDCLQGDNAPYYFNYVDTQTPHLYPRLAKYMRYDVVTVGNHDIETGHPVYDRVCRDLKKAGIPFFGGNAIRNDDGKPYFETYRVFRRAGLKVLVLGYTNANMAAWLNETIWSGMHFVSLLPLVQQDVDRIKAKVKPDVTVVSVHSGTGMGDGSILESQGMDLFNSLEGVDLVLCSHDHRPVIEQKEGMCLMNSGSHSRNVAHAEITLDRKNGKIVSKKISGSLIPVDKTKADPEMRAYFQKDYDAVKAFTLREVGALGMQLRTRDSFAGMCDYINLIHTVQLEASGAQVSFAAPLTFNGTVEAGTLIYNDMFTIYPYENQLYTIKLTGKEIKDYLEYSYDHWIQTYDAQHVLRISPRPDPRYQQKRWAFDNASFNFDSAAGIIYSVDVTKKNGSRIDIKSLADGSEFKDDATYTVAMTSYRASGGGDLIFKGAGLTRDELDSRISDRFPEIRELIYHFIENAGTVTPDMVENYARIGYWSFMPQPVAGNAVSKDMKLLFGE